MNLVKSISPPNTTEETDAGSTNLLVDLVVLTDSNRRHSEGEGHVVHLVNRRSSDHGACR